MGALETVSFVVLERVMKLLICWKGERCGPVFGTGCQRIEESISSVVPDHVLWLVPMTYTRLARLKFQDCVHGPFQVSLLPHELNAVSELWGKCPCPNEKEEVKIDELLWGRTVSDCELLLLGFILAFRDSQLTKGGQPVSCTEQPSAKSRQGRCRKPNRTLP